MFYCFVIATFDIDKQKPYHIANCFVSLVFRGNSSTSIVVTLSPELEALLRDKAARQGQDINLVASALLASVLEWEVQDSEEAVKGIQQGLDDFEADRFRSFHEFDEEQRRKYNLSADS